MSTGWGGGCWKAGSSCRSRWALAGLVSGQGGRGKEQKDAEASCPVCVLVPPVFFLLRGRQWGIGVFFVKLYLGGILSQHMVVSAPVIICVREENEPFFSRASCDDQWRPCLPLQWAVSLGQDLRQKSATLNCERAQDTVSAIMEQGEVVCRRKCLVRCEGILKKINHYSTS